VAVGSLRWHLPGGRDRRGAPDRVGARLATWPRCVHWRSSSLIHDAFGWGGSVALHAVDPEFRFVLVHATYGEAGDIRPTSRRGGRRSERSDGPSVPPSGWAVGRIPDRRTPDCDRARCRSRLNPAAEVRDQLSPDTESGQAGRWASRSGTQGASTLAAVVAKRPRATAAGRAAVRPRAGLPVPATPLVGRDEDIAAVATLLSRSSVRLVTLTGIGGIGKTRLVLAVTERVGPTTADGPAFLPLLRCWTTRLFGQILPGLLVSTLQALHPLLGYTLSPTASAGPC
jgi:hypothetical protein